MEFSIYSIIFYLLLIDSVGAVLLSLGYGKELYIKHFRIFSRHFPVTKGWTIYYLILVILYGITLYKFGELSF